MVSVALNLICGFCAKILSDPYRLPCGHTFCLRPCLLPLPNSLTARCIQCQVKFGANELRPTYEIGAKLCLLQLKEKEEEDGQQREEEEKSEKSVVMETETQCPSVRCSTCRRPCDANQLGLCHHCHRNVCPQCRTDHYDSCALVLRVKLNALSSQKIVLKSRLEELKKSNSMAVEGEKEGREGIIAELERAVTELRAAASQALESATAKLEMIDIAGLKGLNLAIEQVINLSVDVRKVGDSYSSLDNVNDLEAALVMQRSLQRLSDDAALLEGMKNQIKPLPVTRVKLSDGFSKINAHVRGFSFLTYEAVNSLPQTLSRLNIQSKNGTITTARAAATSNTNATSEVKLYVDGLKQDHTASCLRQHFAQYGALIDCEIIRDFKSKKSKGYGFVTFQKPEDASRALADFPHFVDGSPVHLRSCKLYKKSKKGSGLKVDKCRLFVSNLDPSTTKQELNEYFSHYGKVTGVKLIRDPGNEKAQGIAFINMATPLDAEDVLDARPHQLKGQRINVQFHIKK